MKFKRKIRARVIESVRGKSLMFDGGLDNLSATISEFPTDKEVIITIEGESLLRSEAQNGLYWLYLGVIADDTGSEKDVLHELFSRKFLLQSRDLVEVGGVKYEVPTIKSTTKLSVGEFVEYLLKIEELCEIPIPDTEFWRNNKYGEKDKPGTEGVSSVETEG